MIAANLPTPTCDTVNPKVICCQLASVLERAAHLFETAASALQREAQIAALKRRLSPDMFCLAQQVVVLSDGLVGAAALLCGARVDEQPAVQWVFNRGDEDTLGPLDEDFDAAVRRLGAARQQVLAQGRNVPTGRLLSGGDAIVVERPGHRRRFQAPAFVGSYVVPNAYFHLTMIYALLRASGARIGKADFEGSPAYVID